MASESSLEWWRERWLDGNLHWHLGQKNPNLLRNLHHLNDGSRKPQDAGLLFVPMCGKSVDMKYLYDEGYRVYGIDCAETAVRDFFLENHVDYEWKRDERIGDVYSTSDGRLRVVCGDIFKLTPEIVGEPVQMVWDRGALIAVDKELRKSYARVMCKLVGSGARYLLDTLHYSDWYYSGPPRNVPPKLIECLFDQHFEITMLVHNDITKRMESLGVSPVFQNIFLMVAKSK